MVVGYEAGGRVTDLAAQFGVNRGTVNAILRRHGVTLRKPGLQADDVAVAARLYRDGWPLARLGAKFGVDGTTVWRELRSAGVEMRSPNERPAPPLD